MAKISNSRKDILRADKVVVEKLYKHAVEKWGKEAVDNDLTRLWDLRCIWGMQNVLPFGSTFFTNLGEMLWIAEEVCGYGRRT